MGEIVLLDRELFDLQAINADPNYLLLHRLQAALVTAMLTMGHFNLSLRFVSVIQLGVTRNRYPAFQKYAFLALKAHF